MNKFLNNRVIFTFLPDGLTKQITSFFHALFKFKRTNKWNRANSLTLIPNPYTSLIHALGWGTSEINTPFLTILIIDKCNNGFCAANSVDVSPLTPQASNETPKKSHAEFPRLKFFSVRD